MKNHPLVSHHLRVIEKHTWPSGLTSASIPDVLREGSIESKVPDKDIATGYGGAWIRDNAYVVLGTLYSGDIALAYKQLHALLNIFQVHIHKLQNNEGVHAKVNPRNFEEITPHWGHRQHDALGIVLWVAAECYARDNCILSKKELNVLQEIIHYLERIEYWHMRDFGKWEECEIRHSSSIGSVLGGLRHIRNQHIEGLSVPVNLMENGEVCLNEILPYESRDVCGDDIHYHCCDSAQLFLIWPHNVLNENDEEEVLRRLLKGHGLRKKGKYHHKLRRRYGLQRYWGDRYGMTDDWHSVQWGWHPLLSIIYAQRGRYNDAYKWYRKGLMYMTEEGYIPEFRTRFGHAGVNTPLAWMHALSIVAYSMLPSYYQNKISKKASFLLN